MGFLSWIILGGIAGAIAKAIMPGKDPGGMFVTIALGVVGGLLGGGVSSALFGIPMGHFFDIRSWIIAILGAVAVLAVYRWLKEKYGDDDGDTPNRGGGDHAKYP